jgi:hypothetical protein
MLKLTENGLKKKERRRNGLNLIEHPPLAARLADQLAAVAARLAELVYQSVAVADQSVVADWLAELVYQSVAVDWLAELVYWSAVESAYSLPGSACGLVELVYWSAVESAYSLPGSACGLVESAYWQGHKGHYKRQGASPLASW